MISYLNRATSNPIYATLLVVLTGLFLSFPSLDVILFTNELDSNWISFFEQAQDPFTAREYNISSHQSKMAFRITPALIFYFLPKTKFIGVAVQFVIGILFIYYFIVLLRIHQQEPDKRWPYLLALCGLYPMLISFIDDYRGIFDGLSLLFLVLAMYTKKPILSAFCIILAAFTDERAYFAALLVPVYHILSDDSTSARINRKTASVFFQTFSALAIAVGLRLVIGKLTGLHVPTGTGAGAGIGVLEFNIHTSALATCCIFEASWMIIIASMAYLLPQNRYLVIYIIAVASTQILVSLMVYDVTRSLAYMLPLLVIGYQLCIRHNLLSENNLKYIAFANVIIPTSYFTGNLVMWVLPAPLQVARMLFL